MPVPVAESTRQPGEKPLSPGKVHGEESLARADMRAIPEGGGRKLEEGTYSDREGKEPEWALPQPSEPRAPPWESATSSKEPPQTKEEQKKRPPEQQYPTPEQQLIELDKRRRRKLVTLARDHIMKLREERQQMAYEWLREYSRQASFAKVKGEDLGPL